MNKQHIAIGADHRGYTTKQYLIDILSDVLWIDVGTYNNESADYPLYAKKVCDLIAHKDAQKGILLCGSGIGMTIMANRFNGIYAALVWNERVATQSREHDNTNILVLPADYLSHKQAVAIVHAWLSTDFSQQDRYKRRIAEIDALSK